MNFIDIWTIITGAASIISLLIVMSDKFPKWKNYIAPAGFILGGFAVGRISAVAIPVASRAVEDTRFVGFIIILVLILSVLFIAFKSLLKRQQDWYAFFIIFMVISIGVPNLFDKYTSAFPDIPKEDILLLAKVKEENSDYAGAMNYLERYKNMVSNIEMKNKVESKIKSLQDKQLSIK